MKKMVVVLLVCMVMLTTVAAATELTKIPSPQIAYTEAMRQADFDAYIEMYKDSDPEMAAYYAKWRDVSIPSPYPAEWFDADGYLKDDVATGMLYEKFRGSVLEDFYLDEPGIRNGANASVTITIQDGVILYSVSAVTTQRVLG